MTSKRILFYSLFFCALCAWVYINYYWQLHKNLIFENNHPYQIVGIIDSLPQYQQHHLSFIFKLQKIDLKVVVAHIKLNWYGKSPYLHIGETWQLFVKLKHPNIIPIRDNFNYGRWLKFHDLQAVGYVIAKQPYRRLQPPSDWNFRYDIDRWRNHIEKEIYFSLKDTAYLPEAALISGLTVGIRTNMSKEQWLDFQNTGTVHLMAIAGLHIGFLAGFIYYIFSWLWSRSVNLVLFYPAQKVGKIAAWISAFFYALMAGFALPTQRAFIMMTVITLATFSDRNISLSRSLLIAFVLILLWDPLAITSASFWLSFSAVGLICYGIHGRIQKKASLWWHWGQLQWILTVGLTPITLWFFQQSSISGLIANLFAIPVVGFMVMPLCLLGCIALGINQYLAHWLLLTAAIILHYLMKFLNLIAFMPYSTWHFSLTSFPEFLTMLFAFLLLLAPKGLPVRWMGGLLLICVLICCGI